MLWFRFRSVFLMCVVVLGLVLVRSGWAGFLNVDKMKIRINAAPGEVVSGVITVFNQDDHTVSVKIYPMLWRYTSPYDGKKEFYPLEDAELGQIISVVPRNLVLAAGERKLIRYKISIPSNITRPVYLVLFFETSLGSGGASTNKMNLRLVTRIGTLFFIEPKGIADYGVEFLGCAKLRNGELVLTLQNIGNAVLVGKLDAFVLDAKERFLGRAQSRQVYVPPKEKFEVVLPVKGNASQLLKARKVLLTAQIENSKPASLETNVCEVT